MSLFKIKSNGGWIKLSEDQCEERSNLSLYTELEYEGKKYKGVLYPVEETQQAPQPPIIRVDEKLIGDW
jgi:hypothetical protein